MEVTVELTANHLGWFEFHLCPQDDPSTPVTAECLEQNLLPLATGGTRFNVTSEMRMITYNVVLPKDMICTQCVIQWKYNTGRLYHLLSS